MILDDVEEALRPPLEIPPDLAALLLKRESGPVEQAAMMERQPAMPTVSLDKARAGREPRRS